MQLSGGYVWGIFLLGGGPRGAPGRVNTQTDTQLLTGYTTS